MKINADEYINKKFGRLLIKKIAASTNQRRQRLASCLCDCGKECTHSIYQILNGHCQSCGCLKKEMEKSGVIRKNIPNKQSNYTQFVGQKFVSLLVLDIEGIYFICKCKCGNESKFKARDVISGRKSSCNNSKCYKKPVDNSHLIGQKFNMLTILELNGAWATCKCDCGKIARAKHYRLKKGHSKSCGCAKYKKDPEVKKKKSATNQSSQKFTQTNILLFCQ